jgi:hypothetical protein
MKVNFLNERARKHLADFENRLQAIDDRLDEGDISLSEVRDAFGSIKTDIQSEISRSEQFTTDDDVEEYIYQPALTEALVFFERLDGAESPDDVSGIVYDAKFSLNYYKRQLNEM